MLQKRLNQEFKLVEDDVMKLFKKCTEMISITLKHISPTGNGSTQEKLLEQQEELQNIYIKIVKLDAEVENDCSLLIAKYEPKTADLRHLLGIIQMASEFVKISSNCMKMFKYKLNGVDFEDVGRKFEKINKMKASIDEMMSNTMEAFKHNDFELAIKVQESDNTLDAYNKAILSEFFDNVRNDGKKIDEYYFIISISRRLERIADHISNIAGYIYYIATGQKYGYRQYPNGSDATSN